ncbi:MAG TPA: type 2 isopentenyl-diphosphate Delta-isomerase [Bdellovibrionota bacterium]|nr:type 2 isopentenyl-diphosphate Delta-isomerase [Bdellovibrionota bacterium]
MQQTPLFEQRKRDHLVHALDPKNQAQGLAGLDRVRLSHDALPDLDWDQISLAEPCLGTPLSTPFYVSGMTAGHDRAPTLNHLFAAACQSRGWALGVGSLRRDLEGGGSVDRWRELRALFPDLVILANLGISQVLTASDEDVARVLEPLGPQALCIHTNPLQEAIQPEGTPRFAGSVERLARLCRFLGRNLGIPVVLKEAGCGFSGRTLSRLSECGLAALDVSGLGGTHWGRIEGARAGHDPVRARASETFAEWGVPTVDAVLNARKALASVETWASGGVRTGLDAAKLVALGARRVGFAQPALQAALAEESGSLEKWMETIEFEFRTALFCTGAASPAELRGNGDLWTVI